MIYNLELDDQNLKDTYHIIIIQRFQLRFSHGINVCINDSSSSKCAIANGALVCESVLSREKMQTYLIKT